MGLWWDERDVHYNNSHLPEQYQAHGGGKAGDIESLLFLPLDAVRRDTIADLAYTISGSLSASAFCDASEAAAQAEQPLIGPQLESDRGKKTLVLDLDQTLLVSTTAALPGHDFTIRTFFSTFHVCKRPGLDSFLEALADRYEIAVYTAATRRYAGLMLDEIDKGKVVRWLLHREHCRAEGTSTDPFNPDLGLVFKKDLHRLGRPLSTCIMLDDSPEHVVPRENALPIGKFAWGDGGDRELLDVLPVLLAAFEEEDLSGGRLNALDEKLRGSQAEWGPAGRARGGGGGSRGKEKEGSDGSGKDASESEACSTDSG